MSLIKIYNKEQVFDTFVDPAHWEYHISRSRWNDTRVLAAEEACRYYYNKISADHLCRIGYKVLKTGTVRFYYDKADGATAEQIARKLSGVMGKVLIENWYETNNRGQIIRDKGTSFLSLE